MHLETNLSKINTLSSVREDENIRFRTFLKGQNDETVDNIVNQLHKEITRQIDCTLCGNCCSQLKPELHQEDITKLAQLENITPETYLNNYCERDNFGEIYLKTMPCRYLEEKKCRLYENRPDACVRFPYTNQKGFISRLWGMLEFYAICPIVFNLMEQLKDVLRFRR